jgi:hypothetical protein
MMYDKSMPEGKPGIVLISACKLYICIARRMLSGVSLGKHANSFVPVPEPARFNCLTTLRIMLGLIPDRAHLWTLDVINPAALPLKTLGLVAYKVRFEDEVASFGRLEDFHALGRELNCYGLEHPLRDVRVDRLLNTLRRRGLVLSRYWLAQTQRRHRPRPITQRVGNDGLHHGVVIFRPARPPSSECDTVDLHVVVLFLVVLVNGLGVLSRAALPHLLLHRASKSCS